MTELRWPGLLGSLLAAGDLSVDEAAWAMDEVMSGRATSAQLAAFLVALRAKGETVDELDGLSKAMLGHSRRIDVAGPAVDVVGTGGDLAWTVNISTMAALIAAGAGARVVKHGNRAASSPCGTADVLEELGLDLSLEPEQVVEVFDEVGITFCFAPVHHPSMRHAGPTRRELGIATVFNVLGPLTNPAQPAAQVVGCSDPRLAALMAEVYARRGAHALVFRGDDGLDELTITTTSRVWVVSGGSVNEVSLDPRELGFDVATLEDLRGGDRVVNAGAIRSLLAGKTGPVRDAAILNAAAALVVNDAAVSATELGDGAALAGQLGAACTRAVESVDSGAASDVLERWLAASQERGARSTDA